MNLPCSKLFLRPLAFNALLHSLILSLPPTGLGQGATPPPPSPAMIILPWQTIGILPETRQNAALPLKESYTTWARSQIGQAQSLEDFLATNNPGALARAPNLRSLSQAVLVGPLPPSLAAAGEGLTVTPSLCALADSYLVSLSLQAGGARTLLTAGHHLLGRSTWAASIKQKALPKLLEEALALAWQRGLTAFTNKPTSPPSAMQISLSLTNESSRLDHGSNLCLNLLVEGKLAASGYTVLPFASQEALSSLSLLVPQGATLARSTRHLQLGWNYNLLAHPQARQQFPLTLQLRSRRAEAVFASPIPGSDTSSWTFTPQDDGRVTFDLAPTLTSFLASEQAALSKSKLPAVVKINRAWLYLDKGRAWGLKMNDRLVVVGAEKDIQGHVVGFFGPEAGIVGPGGEAIHEGAIVFVRKGQRASQLGHSVTYDQKTFPTPWPPR